MSLLLLFNSSSTGGAELSQTLGGLTAVSAGIVRPSNVYIRPDGTSYFRRPDGVSYYIRPGAGTTGSLTSTLGSLTLSATSTLQVKAVAVATLGSIGVDCKTAVRVQGSLTATLGALTCSATSKPTSNGSLAATLDSLSCSATAQLRVQGALSASLAAVSGSATATVSVKGTLAGTLGSLGASSTATNRVSGSLVQNLGSLTLSGQGKLQVRGSLVAGLADATVASAGLLKVSGNLSSVLAGVTVASDGTVFGGNANWWIYWYSFEVMTMQKNQAGQSITMLAIDTATGKPKTGDAANLTAYVSKDDGAVTALGDASASELNATNAKGLYTWTLTQAETNADKLVFSGKSTTTNVELIPVTVYTISEMDANIVSANGLPVLTGQFNFAVSAGGRMINNVLDIVPGDEYIAADNTAVSFTDSKFPNLSLFDSAELTVSVAGVAVVDHVNTTDLNNTTKTIRVELTEAQTNLLASHVGVDAFFDLELVRADATRKTVARGPVNILDPLG